MCAIGVRRGRVIWNLLDHFNAAYVNMGINELLNGPQVVHINVTDLCFCERSPCLRFVQNSSIMKHTKSAAFDNWIHIMNMGVLPEQIPQIILHVSCNLTTTFFRNSFLQNRYDKHTR